MAIRLLNPGETLDVAREAPAIVIPLYGAHELFVQCLRSVLAHTDAAVPILVADDHGPEPRSLEWVRELDAEGHVPHELAWLRQPENLGFVGNCNAAFDATAAADVVLVNSDVVVAAGWLDGLRDAARSDTTIATASALTNHGSILSVPTRNVPAGTFGQDRSFEVAAADVRARSERLRPRIPTGVGHCIYIRRLALDLCDGFDTAFAPAYGEEVDFSQRCVLHGLAHVAADDVLVMHHGMGSLGVDGGRNPIQDAHEELIASRHPAYRDSVEEAAEDEHSPLARALRGAQRAIKGIDVRIDGRCLNASLTGTQVLALELIAALHRTGRVKLDVVLPDDPGDDALEAIGRLDGVRTVRISEVHPSDEPPLVVHRPYQVASLKELSSLRRLGHRIVVTQQDLIAYRNPGYFPSPKGWRDYRAITRETLRIADHVVFSSRHALGDALADGLVPAEHASVVPLGVDHHAPRPADVRPPAALAGHEEQPFLLVLGTDFRHKNRLFALKLHAALRARGWEGRLVLAGPTVNDGSSAGEEAEWRALHPAAEDAISVLPAVPSSEKTWLMERCAAVLYPTTYEGFGFVPFEAAAAGRPCLWAPVSSLNDTLDPSLATLVPWDADASADGVLQVLRDPARAQAIFDGVSASAAELTWDRFAERSLELYDLVIHGRAREAARADADRLIPDERYWELFHEIGPTGLSLVGPGEPLLPVAAQRTIAALARRPATRRPLLGAMRAMRRIGGAPPDGEDDDESENGRR